MSIHLPFKCLVTTLVAKSFHIARLTRYIHSPPSNTPNPSMRRSFTAIGKENGVSYVFRIVIDELIAFASISKKFEHLLKQ